MVTEFGMSEKLGLVKLGHKHQEVFLGRDIGESRNYSEEVAYTIDQEVKKIIDSCYNRVHQLLVENSGDMHKVAAALLEKEVIEGRELSVLLGMEVEDEDAPGGAEPGEPEKEEALKAEEPVGAVKIRPADSLLAAGGAEESRASGRPDDQTDPAEA